MMSLRRQEAQIVETDRDVAMNYFLQRRPVVLMGGLVRNSLDPSSEERV